jgi:hypothetical protein
MPIDLLTSSFINGTIALAKGILKSLWQLPSCLNKKVLKIYMAGELSYNDVDPIKKQLVNTPHRILLIKHQRFKTSRYRRRSNHPS